MKKGMILFFTAFSLFAFWGCSKFKVAPFVMPSWDTQFSAPLFDRTYTLREILYKDTLLNDTHLDTNSMGLYKISRTQSIAGIPVGDNLQIEASAQVSAAQSPGDFTVVSPDSVNYTVAYPNGASKGTKLSPIVPPIPSQTETVSPLGTFSKYKSATISKGELYVTIHNGYPAPVNFDSGSINILDASGKPLPLNIHSIGANETFDTTYQLPERTLTNNPSIHFVYSSPGLRDTATLQSSNLLSIFMGFTTLTISSATAIIPPQNTIYLESTVPMGGGTIVDSANVKSGGINLTLLNDFEMQLPITLVFENIVRQGNPSDTLKEQFDLPASGQGSLPIQFIDLSGYQLRMIDQSGNPRDSIHYRVEVGMPGSNGQFVNISTQDSIHATFSMNRLVFSSFTGLIHPTNTFAIASDTQSVDLGDIKSKLTGGVTFVGDSTKLVLTIRSAGLPYFVHMTLKPTSSESSAPPLDSASVDTIIYPGANNVGIGKQFVDALNSFAIRENRIPDRFIVSGFAKVNPAANDPSVPFSYPGWTSPGTIIDTDKITITNTISMPLEIGIINASYIDTTKQPIIYHDSSASVKLGNVDSGEVHIDVTNGLPLRLSLSALLVDTTGTPVIPLDSVGVDAATQFDAQGNPVAPVLSLNTIRLSKDQAARLGRSYLRFDFGVNTSNGSTPVPFSASNTIHLKVYGTLTLRIDKNLTSGK
jgi:hypothetical protein